MDGVGEMVVSRTAAPANFWYSRRAALISIASLFLVIQAISLLTPPLQSSDEPDHLARAYLLSKGEIFLKAPNGETGGDIDTAMLAYVEIFQSLPFQYERKVTSGELRSSRQLTWTGHRKFTRLFNTAVYFPLPYTPQAVAFMVGEAGHLSVATTYYLTRLFSLVTALGLLLTAALVYPAPPFVVALFVTPMSLFQFGSASLDAITFATCALTGALFLRGSNPQLSFNSRMHMGLALCSISLAVSRIALIPLTLLPAALYVKRGSRSYIISAVASFLLSAMWIVYAVTEVKGMPVRESGALGTIVNYLTHPGSLLSIFFHTLSDPETLWSYWAMFIGVLGWFDTPLDPYVYVLFGIILVALAAISFRRIYPITADPGSLILVLAAALSLIFIFSIELVTWTPAGAKEIIGIQGRYFTPIFILLGYAIFRRAPSSASIKWGGALMFLSVTLSIVSVVPKLLYRYWLN